MPRKGNGPPAQTDQVSQFLNALHQSIQQWMKWDPSLTQQQAQMEAMNSNKGQPPAAYHFLPGTANYYPTINPGNFITGSSATPTVTGYQLDPAAFSSVPKGQKQKQGTGFPGKQFGGIIGKGPSKDMTQPPKGWARSGTPLVPGENIGGHYYPPVYQPAILAGLIQAMQQRGMAT